MEEDRAEQSRARCEREAQSETEEDRREGKRKPSHKNSHSGGGTKDEVTYSPVRQRLGR